MSPASWYREPFVHFVVLGLGLFVLWGAVAGEDDLPPSESVVISAEEVQMLSLAFVEQNGEDPSEEQLAALVAERVGDELLYLEGMATGLNRGDPVVRRRVIQKMRFLLEELRPVGEPAEGQLEAWISEHGERYKKAPSLSIEQVFFDAERRTQAEEDARAFLVEADSQEEDLPSGDSFVHGRHLGLRSVETFRRDFGPAFAAALVDTAVGQWGLASSPWGWHVFQVTERVEAGKASEASVRQQATHDWKQARRREAIEAGLAEIRSRYQVVVEGT